MARSHLSDPTPIDRKGVEPLYPRKAESVRSLSFQQLLYSIILQLLPRFMRKNQNEHLSYQTA